MVTISNAKDVLIRCGAIQILAQSTECDVRHCPPASSRDSPWTPTNQSGLGAIIVTRGWSVVTVKSPVAVGVPPPWRLFLMTATAFMLALISVVKGPVFPSSATASIPRLAVPPALQKVAPELWTAPLKGEKCAPVGTPPGVAVVVHLPSNVHPVGG